MFIYKITRNSSRIGLDENAGHIIVARDADEARSLAQRAAASLEGRREWWADRCTVVRLGVYTKNRKTPYITMTDFRAG